VRVLIDESPPRQLARELSPIDVATVTSQGWSGLTNGKLLAEARSAGFSALVTADRNLEFQQNIAQAGIGLIVTVARSNRMSDLRPLIPGIRDAVSRIQAGQVIHVGD